MRILDSGQSNLFKDTKLRGRRIVTVSREKENTDTSILLTDHLVPAKPEVHIFYIIHTETQVFPPMSVLRGLTTLQPTGLLIYC